MRSIYYYWLMLHPYTSLAVAVVTVILAAPLEGPINYWRLWHIGLTMLLVQFSIGLSNDLLDEPFDAIAKPDKPIPGGRVNRRAAIALLAVLAMAGWALGLALGGLAFLVMILGQGCGVVYNLGVKRTGYSWLPHALAAPTLLLWVRVVNETASPAILWAYPLGLLLGPALNIANQLPGAEEAAISGEHNLVHQWGVAKARRLAAALFMLAALSMPMVVKYLGVEAGLAETSALVGIALSLLFLLVAEADRRIYLWPLALLIAATLGVGFHLSVP